MESCQFCTLLAAPSGLFCLSPPFSLLFFRSCVYWDPCPLGYFARLSQHLSHKMHPLGCNGGSGDWCQRGKRTQERERSNRWVSRELGTKALWRRAIDETLHIAMNVWVYACLFLRERVVCMMQSLGDGFVHWERKKKLTEKT